MNITPLPKFNNVVTNKDSLVVSDLRYPREFINGSAIDGTIKPFKLDETVVEYTVTETEVVLEGNIKSLHILLGDNFSSESLLEIDLVKQFDLLKTGLESNRLHTIKVLGVWFSLNCYEVVSVSFFDTFFILSYKKTSVGEVLLTYVYTLEDKWYESTFKRGNPFEYASLTTASQDKLFSNLEDSYSIDDLSIMCRRLSPVARKGTAVSVVDLLSYTDFKKLVKVANFSKLGDILKANATDDTNLVSVADDGVYAVNGIRSFFGAYIADEDLTGKEVYPITHSGETTENMKNDEVSKVAGEFDLEKQPSGTSPISFFVGLSNKYTGSSTKLQEVLIHSNQNKLYPLALSNIRITLKYNKDALSNIELNKDKYPRIPKQVLDFISDTARVLRLKDEVTTTVTTEVNQSFPEQSRYKTVVETKLINSDGVAEHTKTVTTYTDYADNRPSKSSQDTVTTNIDFYLNSLIYTVSEEDYLVKLDNTEDLINHPLVKFNSLDCGKPMIQTVIRQDLFDEDDKIYRGLSPYKDFPTKGTFGLLLGGERRGTGFLPEHSPSLGKTYETYKINDFSKPTPDEKSARVGVPSVAVDSKLAFNLGGVFAESEVFSPSIEEVLDGSIAIPKNKQKLVLLDSKKLFKTELNLYSKKVTGDLSHYTLNYYIKQQDLFGGQIALVKSVDIKEMSSSDFLSLSNRSDIKGFKQTLKSSVVEVESSLTSPPFSIENLGKVITYAGQSIAFKGRELFFSDVGDLQQFNPLNTLKFDEDITDIVPTTSGLFVTTAGTCFRVGGNTAQTFQLLKVSDSVGGQKNTLNFAKGMAIWVYNDDLYYYSSGSVKALSDKVFTKRFFKGVIKSFVLEDNLLYLYKDKIQEIKLSEGVELLTSTFISDDEQQYLSSITDNSSVFVNLKKGKVYKTIKVYPFETTVEGEAKEFSYTTGNLNYNRIIGGSVGNFTVHKDEKPLVVEINSGEETHKIEIGSGDSSKSTRKSLIHNPYGRDDLVSLTLKGKGQVTGVGFETS